MFPDRRRTLTWVSAPIVAVLLPAWRSRRAGRHASVAVVATLLAAAFAVTIALFVGGIRAAFDPLAGRLLIVAATFVSAALSVSVWSAERAARPTVTFWPARLCAAVALTVAQSAALVPAAAATYLALPQIRATGRIFVTEQTYVPGTVPAGPSPRPVAQRPVAVLLIGGDAGPGRWGLRADSLNVVVFNPGTRDAAVIGIPRNLYGAPMPGTLARRFPSGFPDLINALHTWGEGHAAAVIDALGPTDTPGVTLTAAVISELTGIRLDGWVLVDMGGFIDAVDALGPTDIWVDRDISLPGNAADAKHPTPGRLIRGWYRMDGTDLLAYSRSRHDDSDYARMQRQRCVLISLARQHGDPSLVFDWPALAAAAGDGVRTSLDDAQLAQLLVWARTGLRRVHTVSLAPPALTSGTRNLAAVRALVNGALEPVTSAPPGAAPPTTSTLPSPFPQAPSAASTSTVVAPSPEEPCVTSR